MSYITTYTGQHIDPLRPRKDKLLIEDAAHSLSLLCRGNGHVKTFFSVGQHCINCCREALARGYSRRVALACLVHDASEAYMSDVPRPFKKELPQYVRAEEKLLDMIYEKFLGKSLSAEEKRLVRQVDDTMLYYDMLELLGEKVADTAPDIKIELSYRVRPFEEVEREFLDLYHELAEE